MGSQGVNVRTKLAAFLKLHDDEVIDYIIQNFNKLQDENAFVDRLITIGIDKSRCRFVYKILNENKKADGKVVTYNNIEDILKEKGLPEDSLSTISNFIKNFFNSDSNENNFILKLQEFDFDVPTIKQIHSLLSYQKNRQLKLDAFQKKQDDMDSNVILNKIYKCQITGIKQYGIFCKILGVQREPESMCHKSELPFRSRVDDFRVEDSVFAQVTSVQPNGKISISLKNVDQMTGKLLDQHSYNQTQNNHERGRSTQSTPISNKEQLRKLTSPERWEISKLISTGAATLEDYPEYRKYLEEDNEKASKQTSLVNPSKFDKNLNDNKNNKNKKTRNSIEVDEGEELDVHLNKNSRPAFIKKNYDVKGPLEKYEIEPLVKVPKGFLNRNASKGSSLLETYREEKFRKKDEKDQKFKQNNKTFDKSKELKLTGSNNIDIDQINALSAWERKRMRETIEYGKKTNLTIQEQRKSLPVYKMRQELLDAINGNQFLVIVGETGSGKTTQLTQYLYEEGYNANGLMIGCTQPRRVAAISVAKRVAEEMECVVGEEVGYNVRFEDYTSKKTKIKYMTDGMLLREALSDPLMSKYSVILLDEAHERTIPTDVLFSLLKKAATQRPDLKVIITSATLDSEKFSDYFMSCPVLTIPGKIFPVDVLYSKTPQMDYIEAALDTVMEIHINESKGDILVFLTGQEEIDACCEILYERVKNIEDTLDLELIILPVYSALPNEVQSRIFEPTPENSRKVIFATNIAETSITIDGIFYVVDPGFSKVNTYNPRLGIEQLIVSPISQAQANQRKGRAGRTGPGKCYRLYTESAFVNEMLPSTVPDIKRQNLSNTILLLKAMGIVDLKTFEFMDPPPQNALLYALEELYHLQALDNEGNLTQIGKTMSQFPMEPLLSKTLLASVDFKCSEEVLIIISLLSVQNIFYRPKEKQLEADRRRQNFAHPYGDHLTLLNVFNKWKSTSSSNSRVSSKKWCELNFVHERHLKKSQEVYDQVLKIFDNLSLPVVSCGPHIDNVRKSFVSGFFRNSAKKESGNQYKKIVDNTEVSIHPGSVLFGKSSEYLIYHSLIMTTREYMSTVTVIEPKWLVECAPKFFKADVVNNKKMKIEPMENRNGASKNNWRLSSIRRNKENVLSNNKKK